MLILMLATQDYDFKRFLFDLLLASRRELLFVQGQAAKKLSPSGFCAGTIFFGIAAAGFAELTPLFEKTENLGFALRREAGLVLGNAAGQAPFAGRDALAQGIGLLIAAIAECRGFKADNTQAAADGKADDGATH